MCGRPGPETCQWPCEVEVGVKVKGPSLTISRSNTWFGAVAADPGRTGSSTEALDLEDAWWVLSRLRGAVRFRSQPFLEGGRRWDEGGPRGAACAGGSCGPPCRLRSVRLAASQAVELWPEANIYLPSECGVCSAPLPGGGGGRHWVPCPWSPIHGPVCVSSPPSLCPWSCVPGPPSLCPWPSAPSPRPAPRPALSRHRAARGLPEGSAARAASPEAAAATSAPSAPGRPTVNTPWNAVKLLTEPSTRRAERLSRRKVVRNLFPLKSVGVTPKQKQ